MSRLLSKVTSFFSSRTLVGVDKAGNRYFTRKEDVDGVGKEIRWVIFRGEEDPTSLPVEWICWLNGQRKKAPTPQEMLELEALRERVRINVELLKKEEEERKSKVGSIQQSKSTGKIQSPDLKSFIQQFPGASFNERRGNGSEDLSDATADNVRLSEPKGSGESFQPGTWQPP
uniref:NADH dehydrogenase [ubiquinone] 1 alpha subcomplex subunit 12 n=1 Tax=Anthurium amnicola TaxID=1678845 RepID=A0A1D1Y326_9ARAE